MLVYKGEKQEQQINLRSELSNEKFVDWFIQLHLLQKLRNIKINAVSFIFMMTLMSGRSKA